MKYNFNKNDTLIFCFVLIISVFVSAILYLSVVGQKKDVPINVSSNSSEIEQSSNESVVTGNSSSSESSSMVEDSTGFNANTSGVPVLMYHHFMDYGVKNNSAVFSKNSITSTTQEFEGQLKALYERGYKSISIEMLLDYIKNGTKIPNKSVVLTFDDGYLSNSEIAANIMRKYGFKGYLFLIDGENKETDQAFIPDGMQYMSKNDIKKSSDVFILGNHCNTINTHNNFKDLSFEQMKKDLEKSMMITKSSFYAYPLGYYTTELSNFIKSSGFTAAFTIQSGYAKKGTSPMLIPRFAITSPLSTDSFISLIETGKKPS